MKRIAFMGTPPFAARVLTEILKHSAEYEVVAVVTQPDRPVGRKRTLHASAVKEVAVAHDLPVLQPAKLSGSAELDQLIALNVDLIVTAAYGQFLPTSLLNSAKIAAVNVHASLLPKYRGGAPIQYALKNGDKETGVTIMYMVKQMDAGDIISQAHLPILPDDDAGTLFAKLADVGAELLLTTLPKLIANTVTPTPQAEADVVFAPTIKPEEERLHLTQTAQQIDWQVRALRPRPGAYFADFNGKRVKLWDVTVLAETTTKQAGTVVRRTKHELALAGANGTVYAINKLQPAGKPQQEITAYLNGAGQNLAEGQVIIHDENETD